jgi:hypothetical protein
VRPVRGLIPSLRRVEIAWGEASDFVPNVA